MLRKVVVLLAGLALLAGITVGCGGGQETQPAKGETVKIGAVMSMSGALGTMGTKCMEAVELAVEEINAAGGINGKQVELFKEDDATDAATSLQAFKKLVEVNDVHLLVGPMTSGAARTVGPYVSERQALTISPSATSPELTGQPWRDYFFRTVPSDALQGKIMAQVALDEGLKKVVIFVMDNPYGVGLGDAVQEALEGKAEVLKYIKYDPAKLDYRTELTEIKNLQPDCVMHVGYADDGRVVYKQALDLGLDNIRWIGCDGLYGSGLFQTEAAAQFMAKACMGTRPVGPEGGKYEEFRQAYKAKYNAEPEVFCDTVYDAVKLIAAACNKAGTEDPAKVREALLEIGKDYNGASGTITFDDQGDRVSGVYEVWKVVKEGDQYKNVRVKLIPVE